MSDLTNPEKRLYWNPKTKNYQSEFPNKPDRDVHLTLDESLTLKEANILMQLLQEKLDNKKEKAGTRALKNIMRKIDQSVYFSQRY